MDYQQAVDYLTNLSSIEQKRPNLKRIEKFLLCHGSPQNSFDSLHIGGTNGKGSTVAMLDSMLRGSGLKVGRFTGPHILRLNERIHLNGQPIEEDDFAQIVVDLKNKSDLFGQQYPQHGPLSWFEFITAIAFFYFAQHNVDIAVIEVGMGGTFDATNTLQKVLATGITNISLEHTRSLGDTVEKIAQEKAGIIKENTPVVTTAKGEAAAVIIQRARQLNAKLIICDNQTLNNSLAQIKNDLERRGIYQYENALLALYMLSAANLLELNGTESTTKPISLEKALHGLKNFYWPGRFQIIQSQHLILDCAHNPAGIKSLRNSLDKLPNKHPFHFVFACYGDKDGLAMLKTLAKPGDHLYLGRLVGKRPFFANKTLAKFAQDLDVAASIHSTLTEALVEAKAKRKGNEFIVATGSFSVVSEVMQKLGWKSVEDGLS